MYDKWYENPFYSFICPMFFLAILVISIFWYSSGIEAKLFNEQFHTSYSQKEFFFCGKTIKSFLNDGKQTTQNIKIDGALPFKFEE